MVLEVTLAAVSSFGVLATEEGAQPVPGAHCGVRDGHEPREDVDEGGRPFHDDDRRRRREEDGPGELGDDDHTLAAVSIAEHGRERRSGRRREKPRESDEPDGGRAAKPVREYRQRDANTPSAPRSKPPTRPRSAGYWGSGRPGQGARRVPKTCPQRALTRQASHDPLRFSNGRWKIPVPTAV